MTRKYLRVARRTTRALDGRGAHAIMATPMPIFTCRACAARADGDVPPDRCPACSRPADEVYPKTPDSGLAPARSVEDIFDLEPVEMAPPPGGVALQPQTTIELEDDDLTPAEEGAPPAAPGNTGSAAGAGRVTYPVPPAAPGAAAPSHLPREVDELAVAGQPPARSPQQRPLTSQTEHLRSSRGTTRRRVIAVAWLAAAAAVVVGGYRLLSSSPDGDAPPRRDDAHGARTAIPLRILDASIPDTGSDAEADAVQDATAPDPGAFDGGRRAFRPARRVSTRDASVTKRPRVPADRAQAVALYEKGLQQLFAGQAAAAVELFNQSLTVAPRHSFTYRGLGLAYEKLGRRALARAAYERYLLLRPAAPDRALINKRIDKLR